MKRLTMLVVAILMLGITIVFAQNGSIKGTVVDGVSKTPLGGATIAIQGTKLGATSSPKGQFSISGVPAGTYTVITSFIGYERNSSSITVKDGETATAEISMAAGAVRLEDLVVVSTSRKAEKITQSPATIQAVRAQEIENMPIIAQSLMNVRGVDIVRSGVDGIGFNARGFNSAFNTKILAMNDGRFSTLPGNGLPNGNLNTNIKEDIERIELILGPSSALYGPNAHNGIVNTISKDPRTSQGTTLALNVGNQSYLSARARHAGVLGNFAFKATFEYNTARDFEYIDSVYGIAAANANPTGSGRIPEYTKTLDGDIYDIKHIRFEATGIYSLAEQTDLYISYGRSSNWGLGPTNPGRNYINGWDFQYAQIKFVSPRFFAQAYYTWNNSGTTYPVQNVTQLMNKTPIFGPTYTPITASVAAGTVTLEQAVNAAKFVEKSGRWNAEAQYNDNIGGFDIVLGLNYQLDVPKSEGTYLSDVLLSDGTRRTIPSINQIGGAFQVERELVDNLKFVLAGRLDKHDNFGAFFAPKAALVYSLGEGSLRATYGRGINTPTVLNQEVMIPLLVAGGVPYNLRGNGKGFELINIASGAVIKSVEALRPEVIDTYELGYKGVLGDKLYLDINGYYGASKDFISPNIGLGFVKTGFPGSVGAAYPGAATANEYVFSYINFGSVATYGFDVGINYFLTDNITLAVNYSWFSSDIDTTKRDGNGKLVWDATGDGFVSPTEISLNTPTHKGSLTVNWNKLFDGKFYGSLGMRFISEYTFVSGAHYAGPAFPGQELGNRAIAPRNPTLPVSATNPALASFKVNNGPLGGFATMDLTLGYKVLDNLNVSMNVSNLFGVKQREMVGSPAIGRLIVGEVRYTIPAWY